MYTHTGDDGFLLCLCCCVAVLCRLLLRHCVMSCVCVFVLYVLCCGCLGRASLLSHVSFIGWSNNHFNTLHFIN